MATPAKKKKRRPATKKSPVRRRRTLSAAKPKRRRRSTRKKGFLSAMGAQASSAARSMGSGAVGGGLYALYEAKIDMTTWTPEKKGMFALLGSYVLTVYGSKPNVGAGIAGAAFYDYAKTTGLLGDESEQMNRQQWADPLQNVPVMLSENEMYLAAGGDPMAIQDAAMNLQDGNYMPGYAQANRY